MFAKDLDPGMQRVWGTHQCAPVRLTRATKDFVHCWTVQWEQQRKKRELRGNKKDHRVLRFPTDTFASIILWRRDEGILCCGLKRWKILSLRSARRLAGFGAARISWEWKDTLAGVQSRWKRWGGKADECLTFSPLTHTSTDTYFPPGSAGK